MNIFVVDNIDRRGLRLEVRWDKIFLLEIVRIRYFFFNVRIVCKFFGEFRVLVGRKIR